MGKENKKGINVKPDKLVRICFLGRRSRKGGEFPRAGSKV